MSFKLELKNVSGVTVDQSDVMSTTYNDLGTIAFEDNGVNKFRGLTYVQTRQDSGPTWSQTRRAKAIDVEIASSRTNGGVTRILVKASMPFDAITYDAATAQYALVTPPSPRMMTVHTVITLPKGATDVFGSSSGVIRDDAFLQLAILSRIVSHLTTQVNRGSAEYTSTLNPDTGVREMSVSPAEGTICAVTGSTLPLGAPVLACGNAGAMVLGDDDIVSRVAAGLPPIAASKEVAGLEQMPRVKSFTVYVP